MPIYTQLCGYTGVSGYKQKSKIMYCTKCGNEINTEDLFCSKCGSKVEKEKDDKIESVTTVVKATETFEKCAECGEEKRNIYKNGIRTGNTVCLNCNSKKGYCPLCGQKLRTEEAQQCPKCKHSWHKRSTQKKFENVNATHIVKKVDDNVVKCPKCKSQNLSANKKGFGLGKALAGGILLGGVGLLGGFVGSGKIKITCLKCGHTWKP